MACHTMRKRPFMSRQARPKNTFWQFWNEEPSPFFLSLSNKNTHTEPEHEPLNNLSCQPTTIRMNTLLSLPRSLVVLCMACLCMGYCQSFQMPTTVSTTRHASCFHSPPSRIPSLPPSTSATKSPISNSHSRSSTALHVLLDVPDGFFTISFVGAGLILAVSKNFARIRMEENAWEQRLAEARQERLRKDPTLTELDLRRQEAAMEWSAYGKPRREEEAAAQRRAEADDWERRGRRSRVKVMDGYDDEDDGYCDDDDEEDLEERNYRMSDKEIDAFELEFGIDYDPYYDDPYTEDELPEGKFTVDKNYGDRTYENGETFFKDKQSGLYFRQGAKPRNLSFWS